MAGCPTARFRRQGATAYLGGDDSTLEGVAVLGQNQGVAIAVSRRTLWIVAVFLVLGCGLPQVPALHTMKELGTDLLSFQFVSTSERAQQALDGWGDAGRDAARAQLVWDFGFIAGYGLLLWLTATGAGAGRPTAMLGPAAAVADLAENLMLHRLLQGDASQPWPALATLFASLKFMAIGGCLLGSAARKFKWM